ncbi:MAG: hypothetical protein DRR16_09890 [Candidatus Parabeggiatoa sp. nov. 3]|nr:MAG: hypothetical protein DRR00_23025 [Gammaproteobacteria bacterium]RKZ68421.1 MAG: hypothetical protein DRQ99_03840 [Gammaproteobacteria bacterium]RKZ86350.1 MAG: hypothetical protein DRR16_09890 [Gammaproteobacteria bacterium]
MTSRKASSGHKLGQLIGDWFEEYFVLPLLKNVANELQLFIDSRFIKRMVRGRKIGWLDSDGNTVDYDYVLELHGTENEIGIPVAFVECFWRRGARHSKDKARDDTGKLMPMRETYPTARFLGIIAAGDFTKPARDLIRSREIDLFYVPKDKIIKAFFENGVVMDYPDNSTEAEKWRIVTTFEKTFTSNKKEQVQHSLITQLGTPTINSYVDRVRAALSALPQEIRFILRHDGAPLIFESLAEASQFLKKPNFSMGKPQKSYLYQITFSDGSEFEKTVTSLEMLKQLHQQIELLASHLNQIILQQ